MAVYKSITFDNRKKIAALYAKGMSISDISDEVGVALRTLYVELKRGATGKLDQNQRPAYDPVLAQRTYQENIGYNEPAQIHAGNVRRKNEWQNSSPLSRTAEAKP